MTDIRHSTSDTATNAISRRLEEIVDIVICFNVFFLFLVVKMFKITAIVSLLLIGKYHSFIILNLNLFTNQFFIYLFYIIISFLYSLN